MGSVLDEVTVLLGSLNVPNDQENVLEGHIQQVKIFGTYLKNEEFAKIFVTRGGIRVFCKLLKVNHRTIQKHAINGLLTLLCHLSVLEMISFEMSSSECDKSFFVAVVDLTYVAGGTFNVSRINAAASFLTILLDISNDGAELFNEAIKITAKIHGVSPYSHLVEFLKIDKYFLNTLCLMECIMRSSILFSFTDELIISLRDCAIQEAFKCMNAAKSESTLSVLEFDMLCKVIRRIEGRIATCLNVQMAPYGMQLGKLEKGQPKILKHFGLEMITERNRIRQHPAYLCFYQSLQLNLSGMIDQIDAIPFPDVQWYRLSKRKEQNDGTSTDAINSGATEKVSEACARVLTFRYAEQLNMMNKEDATSLGAFGAELILEGIQCGSLSSLRDSDGSSDSMFSLVEIVSRLVNVVGLYQKKKKKLHEGLVRKTWSSC